MTSLDEIIKRVEEEGFTVSEVRELAQGGKQLRTEQGPIVNVFDTGTVQVQGKNKDALEAALVGKVSGRPQFPKSVPATSPREVFVVYGHDETAKVETEAMLRRWGLTPILLDQIPAEGYTLIEKLEHYAQKAPFAVVLATADDVVLTSEDEKEYRARQNVVLELGMVLAHLGRPNVAILLQDRVGMRKPSDIDGLEYLSFKDNVRGADVKLAKMMANRGYPIDVRSL